MMDGGGMWLSSRARAQSSPSTGIKQKRWEIQVSSPPLPPFFPLLLFGEGGDTGSGFIAQVGLKLSSLAYTS